MGKKCISSLKTAAVPGGHTNTRYKSNSYDTDYIRVMRVTCVGHSGTVNDKLKCYLFKNIKLLLFCVPHERNWNEPALHQHGIQKIGFLNYHP